MTDAIREAAKRAERAERQAADVTGPSDRIVWIETEEGRSVVYDRVAATTAWINADRTVADPDATGGRDD